LKRNEATKTSRTRITRREQTKVGGDDPERKKEGKSKARGVKDVNCGGEGVVNPRAAPSPAGNQKKIE